MVVGTKNPQGQLQELLHFHKIEQACMQENCSCFSQSTAVGTPFTCEMLLGEFGCLVVGDNVQNLLKGTYTALLQIDP